MERPKPLEEESLACLDVEWWVCCMQTLHPALELDIITLQYNSQMCHH
jgi:hypothetical protein